MQRGSRRVLTALAVVAGLTAVVLAGGFAAMYFTLRHDSTGATRARQAAERTLEPTARGYADSVVAHSHGRGGPTDAELATLRPHGLGVRQATRTPDLTLVVDPSAAYPEMFGGGSVHRCFAVAFQDLGGPAAGYRLTALPQCPSATPPAPGTGPSGSPG